MPFGLQIRKSYDLLVVGFLVLGSKKLLIISLETHILLAGLIPYFFLPFNRKINVLYHAKSHNFYHFYFSHIKRFLSKYYDF